MCFANRCKHGYIEKVDIKRAGADNAFPSLSFYLCSDILFAVIPPFASSCYWGKGIELHIGFVGAAMTFLPSKKYAFFIYHAGEAATCFFLEKAGESQL